MRPLVVVIKTMQAQEKAAGPLDASAQEQLRKRASSKADGATADAAARTKKSLQRRGKKNR